MTQVHTEETLESAIEASLLDQGWEKGHPEEYDRERALFPDDLFAYIQDTQPELWAQLQERVSGELKPKVLDTLTSHLDKRGTLEILRNGFKFYGERIQAAQFQPAHDRSINPGLWDDYDANRLVVTRQVEFLPGQSDSIDLLLSLNGLPIATAELKNQLTDQNAADAIEQYKKRDPSAKLFQYTRRALVHFAVDADEVYYTTRLQGDDTFFLPFNKGHEGGAGNPPNPDGYRTEYLWEEVWHPDSFLEIVGEFMHVLEEEKWEDGEVKIVSKLLFPRYHQLDVVRKLVDDSRSNGAGQSRLIQHSTGSGKTASISWLAHQLARLHGEDQREVFDSVVVVTDRRHLDQQLQDAIYQIERKQGVVKQIDEHSDQLANALERGRQIIVTTLHKFPFVTDKVDELPGQNFAVIIDEAHRSQTGEMARQMKETLRPNSLEEAAEEDRDTGETFEDRLVEVMESRGPQENLSFFAFTGTPKGKTLQVFGDKPSPDEPPEPFHVYSMRQAIEEEFILDVLENYTTYQTFYRLVKTAAGDPEVPRKKATAALARYLSRHPHDIAQKTQVMVEHFRENVQNRINGQAKAMVLSSSRLHAVRYRKAFETYLQEQGYEDIGVVVAFSGTVRDPETGAEYTEAGMNDFAQSELPRKFSTDDYQILIVANKYQTGFDQPLLQTMYVDKPLSGVRAVQGLSRLNRQHPGKDQVFVLDFVNNARDIQDAFRDYYERTLLSEEADPQQLYDLKHDLDQLWVYQEDWIEGFAEVFYKPTDELSKADQAAINRYLDSAVERFRNLSEDEQTEFRDRLKSYVRLYSFVTQVMPFTDADLEKLFAYGRFLLKKLPTDGGRQIPDLRGDVELEYYRLEKQKEADLSLGEGEEGAVGGPTEVGTGDTSEEEERLSEIIEVLNERFGTEFSEEDRLFFEQVEEKARKDEEVVQRAHANDDFENFLLFMGKKLSEVMADRLAENEEITSRFFDNDDFKEAVNRMVSRDLYNDIRDEQPTA